MGNAGASPHAFLQGRRLQIAASLLSVWCAGCQSELGGGLGASTETEPSAQGGSGGASIQSLTPGSGGAYPDAGASMSAGSVGAEGGAGPAGQMSDAAAPPGAPPVLPPGVFPLFSEETQRSPATVSETAEGLVTRFADRARDRHARESQFQAYEHYLSHYWEHRTAQVEIIDTVAKGGDTITFNVTTEWKLDDNQAELRFFFRGIGTVAEYHNNGSMTPLDDLHYTRSVTRNAAENRELRIGDLMEFELSQFLDSPPRGRDNYYGTTYLYVVGQGLVPWEGAGELRDSRPVPDSARLGGMTTVHRNESDEPQEAYTQMATNTAPDNGQKFMVGRRLMHTNLLNGRHDESPDNPVWTEQSAKLGPRYVNVSCGACHQKNGRALAPAVGTPLDQYVFKVGQADGSAHPELGAVLQPNGIGVSGEGEVSIANWEESDGLRKPVYSFQGAAPAQFSARISPPLVGLGLLEAIDELDIAALADPDDHDQDGISGRMRIVTDQQGINRLGRFGWKAGQPTVQQQVASALHTDLGVLTSDYGAPDCGAAQADCGPAEVELEASNLEALTLYVALLGIRPQRNYSAAPVQMGTEIFERIGCEKCHTSAFNTSSFAALSELRDQAIQPYTDLLLHDMGPGLADSLAEGEASGAEWRTTPLWGIGHSEAVSGGEGYLHDGRARSLTEAILWHAGEGEASRLAFQALSADEQDALLAFLKSL